MAKQLRMWGPAALWAAVLFLLSAWSNPAGPPWLVVNDKVAHVVLFGVLGAFLALGRIWSASRIPHVWMLAVGMLYGMSDEWHQSLVPNRTPSLGDWLADTVGVTLGYLLIICLARRAVAVPGPESGTS